MNTVNFLASGLRRRLRLHVLVREKNRRRQVRREIVPCYVNRLFVVLRRHGLNDPVIKFLNRCLLRRERHVTFTTVLRVRAHRHRPVVTVLEVFNHRHLRFARNAFLIARRRVIAQLLRHSDLKLTGRVLRTFRYVCCLVVLLHVIVRSRRYQRRFSITFERTLLRLLRRNCNLIGFAVNLVMQYRHLPMPVIIELALCNVRRYVGHLVLLTRTRMMHDRLMRYQ